MAENKKGFILYADIIHTVKKMPRAKAGDLFLTILAYVNDENPVVKDPVVDLVFEPIKQQLKRDLKKYEKTRAKRSEAGKLGAEVKKQQTQAKQANAAFVKQPEAKQADSVNGNVNVSVLSKESNMRDVFFKDLPNSIDFQNILSDQGLTREYLLSMIPEFKAKGANPSYPKFQLFTEHFARWVRVNKASAVSPSGKIDLPTWRK